MGHIRLAVLPNSRRWQLVSAMLGEGVGSAAVVAAAAEAAERERTRVGGDPTLVDAMRLLAMIPQAARSERFAEELRVLGLDVPDKPLMLDLVAAGGRALDRQMDRPGARNDFGEIVRSAFVETLSSLIAPQLPGLFGADAEDVRNATARLGRSPFPTLTREFFSRITRDSLAYCLSRELAARVGSDGAFGSLRDRAAFDAALDQHCREASRIIKKFSSGWYSKTLHEYGVVDSERASGFAGYWLKKIGWRRPVARSPW